jgi:lysine-ketoglutarate reductase/saccharopine dehydrogenase-like protein (TIGR00300 family)
MSVRVAGASGSMIAAGCATPTSAGRPPLLVTPEDPEAFVDSVRRRVTPLVDGVTAVRAMEVAERIREVKRQDGKVLAVAGPAVVHVGAREDLSRLIQGGYIDFLFGGNGLATHDLECALFGTSLGIPMSGGAVPEAGHTHHLRTINRIRSLGSISNAVEQGVVRQGIMYSCVKHGVEYVLAGSIRDDGPLPDTITDTMQAQTLMRDKIRQGVSVALMFSTMLHSIAVGNILPASAYTVCVDINPGTLTKLLDRGSLQTVGVVMDVGSFIHELAENLEVGPVDWR